jgi:hypothetical protein
MASDFGWGKFGTDFHLETGSENEMEQNLAGIQTLVFCGDTVGYWFL